MKPLIPFFCFIMLLLYACGAKQPGEQEEKVIVQTPVVIDSVQFAAVTDSLELNATSTYLQNSYVKSAASGYIKSVSIKPGDLVHGGEKLFAIETKESAAIGATITSLDSSFKFSGLIAVKAMGHGFITQLNHVAGDYVQDGEQLAVVSDQNSFGFLLNVPYEDRNIVLANKQVTLMLPDGTHLAGSVGTVFPTVDSLTQTQGMLVRVNSKQPLPQNLIAKVHIARYSNHHGQTVVKSAVLSDETQSNFWLMKIVDSTTAVKVTVLKGLTIGDRIEITSPKFNTNDRVVISGNYGLPDTAKVTIVHAQ